MFEHPSLAKRTLRELKLLRLLDHDNILKTLSIQKPRSKDKFSEVFVVTELMSGDLTDVLSSDQELS